MTNTKLFVVSTHAFSGQVKKEADWHLIGLILVSPNHEITEDSFVLPRTPGSQNDEEVLWHMMFIGTNNMTKPILVYDSGRIDDSLSFASWPASSTSTSSSGNTLTSSFSSGESTSYKKIAEKLQIRKILRIFAAMITYNINFLLK
jgi:hypothetical protein